MYYIITSSSGFLATLFQWLWILRWQSLSSSYMNFPVPKQLSYCSISLNVSWVWTFYSYLLFLDHWYFCRENTKNIWKVISKYSMLSLWLVPVWKEGAHDVETNPKIVLRCWFQFPPKWVISSVAVTRELSRVWWVARTLWPSCHNLKVQNTDVGHSPFKLYFLFWQMWVLRWLMRTRCQHGHIAQLRPHFNYTCKSWLVFLWEYEIETEHFKWNIEDQHIGKSY